MLINLQGLVMLLQFENIKRMKELSIWVEVTTLIVPTKNSSSNELREIAKFIASVDKAMPWHLSAFHPDYKEQNLPKTSLDMLLMVTT